MKAWIAGGALAATTLVAGALSAQIAPDAERPMAGEYSSKMTLVSIDMPGAPPQMADMMRQMMSREVTYCLTEAEIEEGFQAITNGAAQDASDCEYERFSYSAGKIDAAMVCKADGRDMRMVMQGTGSATASDMTMTMSGDFGMGQGTMTMRVQQERIGDCS